MTLYNFTNHYGVMTYLEYPIILFQIFVMLYYALLYKRMMNFYFVPLAAMLYVALVLSFVMELLPSEILSCLVVSVLDLVMYHTHTAICKGIQNHI